MKKLLKLLGILVSVFVAIVIIFLVYFNLTFPKTSPAADVKVEITPERVARGEYLANHVTGCVDCHSKRDFSKFAGPLIPASRGMGERNTTKLLSAYPELFML